MPGAGYSCPRPVVLFKVQQALLSHTYQIGGIEKSYTRRGINDTVNWIHRIWKWGLGRGIVKTEQVQGLEEVKALHRGEAPERIRRKKVTEEELL